MSSIAGQISFKKLQGFVSITVIMTVSISLSNNVKESSFMEKKNLYFVSNFVLITNYVECHAIFALLRICTTIFFIS